MKQFIFLVFVLNYKLASSKNIIINHGDSQKTKTSISENNEFVYIFTNQENEGGLYFTKNVNTGVKVMYLLPIETTKEDAILSQKQKYSIDGKYYTFRYSTAKKETREEEIETNDSGNINVKGSFSYINPSGFNYIQGYEADENGYRTKLSFGTKIQYSNYALKSFALKPPEEKAIDATLLCSLGGSGC